MKCLIGAALAALCLTTAVAAQDYPTRAVTIIAPFGAGSGTDVVARIFAERLEAELGQPFIVDNKPGASGTMGAGLAARAEPDGYTLTIGGTSSHAASRSLMKNVPYDPVKDFEAIAGLGEYPYFLLVNAKDPYTDLKSLVEGIRKTPGEMTVGYGNALGQLSGSVLKAEEKLDLTIVPYKSSPAAIQDLLGQRITFMFNDLVAALPQVKEGSLRILAVTTAERTPLMPDVPTLKEAGFPFFSISAWSGIFAPKGTPPEIIEKLRQALIKITQQDDVKKKLADMGFAVREDHSQPFGDYVAADVKRWAEYTKTAGIEPQ
ncbi:ABC transporter substrate-binding protein [Agaricicola taiwanensis]|uniref:ABC transporter substrate-binding protein n=1 Tax=Agaricicola taiwanensis TaxID=591372 RepID=A0A8J2VK87_9RHOB|nr:tripartite tricarboxylate transporter substrate binding protein [Agaricicola taiwanensis]GGE33835.1 ABC transporter substrate-binding protein [Agaricicola taiwanensis]